MRPGKYEVLGAEAECEPGSNGLVLKNLLGITDPEEMEEVESRELIRATRQVLTWSEPDHQFTAADVRYVHKLWLEPVYDWAGNYREMDISKGGFLFARAQYVRQSMDDLEAGALAELTPCGAQSEHEHSRALAVVHVELVVIHPFRDANGRAARLLSQAMSVQAGYSGLDFGPMDEEQERYFRAVRIGAAGNYVPMQEIFAEILERSAA